MKSKDAVLSPKQREIIEKADIPSEYLMVLFLGAYAGLRVSEMIQCRFSWLEWVEIGDKRVVAINIPESDRDIKNKLKVWTPKTKRQRSTYIFDAAKANSVYFWYENNKDGLKYTRQHITTRIIKGTFTNEIKKALGYHEPLTAHGLRATYQNYLSYELDLDVKFIAVAMGHADTRTTMKFYNTMNKNTALSYLENKEWKN